MLFSFKKWRWSVRYGSFQHFLEQPFSPFHLLLLQKMVLTYLCVCICVVLMFFLVKISSFCVLQFKVLIFDCIGITLLDLKSTLNDSNNLLSNWKDTDESPCEWTGISCYPNSQTVRIMYVSWFWCIYKFLLLYLLCVLSL